MTSDNTLLDWGGIGEREEGYGEREEAGKGGWQLHSTLAIISAQAIPSHRQRRWLFPKQCQSNICYFRCFSQIVKSDFRHQNFLKSMKTAIS